MRAQASINPLSARGPYLVLMVKIATLTIVTCLGFASQPCDAQSSQASQVAVNARDNLNNSGTSSVRYMLHGGDFMSVERIGLELQRFCFHVLDEVFCNTSSFDTNINMFPSYIYHKDGVDTEHILSFARDGFVVLSIHLQERVVVVTEGWR